MLGAPERAGFGAGLRFPAFMADEGGLSDALHFGADRTRIAHSRANDRTRFLGIGPSAFSLGCIGYGRT